MNFLKSLIWSLQCCKSTKSAHYLVPSRGPLDQTKPCLNLLPLFLFPESITVSRERVAIDHQLIFLWFSLSIIVVHLIIVESEAS